MRKYRWDGIANLSRNEFFVANYTAMRKWFLFFAVFISATSFSQRPTPRTLKKVMELKMPLTKDDDKAGTRGAAVTWHPGQKKYYASFAGNVDYPMGVFDATGKRVSETTLKTQADTRGLWYDPNTKLLTGNGYGDFGWFQYKLDENGIPYTADVIVEGKNQPESQCQGQFYTPSKQVLFFWQSQVYKYSRQGAAMDSMLIHWGRTKDEGPGDDEDLYYISEDYNNSAMIYTGIKGQELGFLNITNKEIEFYDIANGFRTEVVALPENAPVESVFNFAFANGTYWLFDMELRKWVGYK
jgi:hypothetical protein